MERLNFALPDFTRISWVSDRARETWQPRVEAIGVAWSEIEWRSILAGVRDCCITVVTPEQYVERAGEWARLGLSTLPIEIQGLSQYSYAATGVATAYGQPFGFRLVVGATKSLASFKDAYDAGDNEAIGRLLGYPSCCTKFFEKVWVEQQLIDTTWSMAAAADGLESVEVSGPIEANILWRWMGVRAVPHLPCRFDCSATVELGRKLIQVGCSAGFDQAMGWLREILNWPAEWSALHAIAEIKTPVLKVSARTDATARKITVRRIGEAYPEEGAQGVRFPYRMQTRVPLTHSRGFQQGLDQPIGEAFAQVPPWYAADNGFNSCCAMDTAHKPIVELASQALAGQKGNVLDLGCGNGALLKKICQDRGEIAPFGVDLSDSGIAHARELFPDQAEHFKTGNLFECDRLFPADWRCALVLLMPGRLLEVPPTQADRLRRWLSQHADRILVYAYGDWLTRYGGLGALAQKAGLAKVAANSLSAAFALV